MALYFESPEFKAVQAEIPWLTIQTTSYGMLVRVAKILQLGKSVSWMVSFLRNFTEGSDYGSGAHSNGEGKLQAVIHQLLGLPLGGVGIGPSDGDPIGPVDPVDPVDPPTEDLPPTYNADEAYTRLMSHGVTYRGNRLDTNDFIRRVERVTFGGVPTGWETKEYRLTMYLIVAGVINPYPNAFGAGEAPPEQNTLQEWLDVQAMLAGYSPSGNASTFQGGPGGND